MKGTFKFDVLALPLLSCLWHSVDVWSIVQTYTLLPLLFVALIAAPVAVGRARGLHITAKDRWNTALDRFWKVLMFGLFLLYPMLSLVSVTVFHCNHDTGRLFTAFDVVCPPTNSFASIYSFVFFLLYPIGIPVMMHLVLRFAGIRKVVQEYVRVAEFEAMISLYVKRTCLVGVQRFAHMVGGIEDN